MYLYDYLKRLLAKQSLDALFMCLCRFVALRVTLNHLCCGLLSRIQLRVIDQSCHTGRNESALRFQAEAPVVIFSGGASDLSIIYWINQNLIAATRIC